MLDAHENDPAFALAHLTTLLKAFPYYNNVATTDQHGNLKLTVLPSSGPVNYADRLWFKRVAQTKDFSIGEYVFGRITKAHIITLAYPIINKQGQLRGTIFVSLDLTWLYNQLNPLSMPKDSSLTILDSKGVVLVVIPDQGKWVGKPFPESTLLRNILSRPQGTEESKGIDGVGRIVSYTSVQGTARNMFVSYGIAKDNALASINRTLMRNMALLLFVFVLSIIGVIFFGNVFILQKVRKLVTASERLGHGDFKARTDLPYRGDELSQVAEALDKMAENVERYDIERKKAEEVLRKSEQSAKQLASENELIAEIGQIISSTLNIEEVYERFADKVREVLLFDRIAVNKINLQDYTRTIQYTSGDKLSHNRVGDVHSIAGSGIEEVMRTKSGLLINSNNLEDSRRKFPGITSLHSGGQSTIIVPLISNNEVIGAFVLHSANKDAYSENDLRLADRVANQITGAIANAQLIDERNLMEQQRKDMEEKLKRSEKMEALGTLAGGVAHDLNNVLGIIVGYSELILDGVDASNSIKPHLVNIMNGGLKAAAIVDDLLTLARRGVRGRSILNLNQIIVDCQHSPEFANLSFHHPSVKIITDMETDLLNISGSSVHLGKSLYNLISNASEAMPKGGTVTIKTTNQYLDKPIHGYDEVREGDYVVISVSDTGEGISANDLKRIFEPFYTKKIMGRSGTGLGLAVVWGTVKDHNGYINVESEEGKGSTFTLYFPVTREDITTEATAIPIARYMGNGESILVVDDVKEQRELAVSLLGPLNYKLTSVASGEEAVAYLKTHEVDLMLLDMIMDPGMDGLDTYRQVLEIRPNQKAIIVSGFSESDRVKISEGLGVGAYLRKPYIKEKLGLAVRKELDRGQDK